MGLKQELIRLRWKVRLGMYDRHSGICQAICYKLAKDESGKLLQLLREWPEGTGGSLFPIPALGYKQNNNSSIAFSEAKADGNMWNPLYKYGRARRRLLTWLINQL